MHKTKRPLSFLLAVVMVLSVFGGISFNASAAGIMSESFNTTQGSINASINYDGNDISIYAVDGGDSYGFLLFDEDFYANIKARNTQRPVTITGAECTSGQYDIQYLRPLRGTMTINGDTATISDVYSSTLRLEADHTNLKIKAVTVYYYYAVASVTLNETYAAMNIGDTKTLTATVAPDDAMYKNVTWTSADPDIATVSDTGVVTAVAPGRVNVTATADNGTADTSDDKTATFSVRVLGEVETTLSYLVWDDARKKLVEKTGDEACANYELITADTTALEDGKWYTIDDDTTVSGRITVNGTAHLILRDDLILTVPKGVTTTGATLNIYGQRAGTGTLSASAEFTNAGIGGTRQSAGGTVVIHGGTVTATGGVQAAGIGGGYRAAGGTVVIHGGTVTATGGQVSAGIGGGAMGTGGEVAIYGGTVTATGGQQGAGIGGGPQSAGGTVVIHGGTVTATGGQQAAGIGGGVSGAGGTINISGGEVTATGTLGAGIGGGYRAAGGNVTITGGTVKAYSKGTDSNFGAAIGAGSGNSEQGTLMLAENMIVKAETVALADKEWEDMQEVAREDYMNDHAQRRAYLVTPVVAVTGVTLDQEAVTLNIGDTAPLTATVEPADATDKAVAWTSDNTAAVTVDENGVVTAVAPGTANVTAATADGGFTASCAVTVNVPTCTVTWLNDDGSLIDTTTVAYGETPTHADATKTATAQYTYTFSGWTPAVAAVEGDTTYTATFDATVKSYTITWKNDDGSVIDTTTVPYGTVPTHADATKANDAYYTYTFAGWSPELAAVTGDAEYTAQFNAQAKTFTVFVKKTTGFRIDVSDVTGETTVAQLKSMVAEQAGIPASEQRIIFAGKQLEDDKTLSEYNIQKESTLHVVGKAYTITWLNDDGSLIDTTTVAYGETPTHADATKTATAQYTYTFAGWDKEIEAVTGDATYTATFDATVNAYTITWLNDDGSLIGTTTVDYGTVPTHADPTKDATAQYTYTFAGWNTTPVAVTGEATYTATFTATPKQSEPPVNNLQDFMSVRIDDQIYIKYTLHNRDGLESVTVTYYDQDGVEVQQEKSKAANELTFDENGMFVILAEVAPAQIGDMVTVTINANGDSTEYETSIKNYCNHLIANYDGVDAAAVKALAKATLEYGQAANDYFYGTDFYHASDITTITEAVKAENVDAAKATKTLSAEGDIRTKLASASFMALTKPEFRFYTTGLTEAEAVELNSKITTNVNGVTAKFYKNGDAILLEVTGIEAANMDEVITITVGELGTITFSGNDFARMMAKNASTQTLGTALYLYGAAAKACFA